MIYRSIYLASFVLALCFTANSSFGELVGYYSMNEGVGTEVADASGYQNHGSAEVELTWVNGPQGFGTALFFDGSNPARSWVNCGTWNPSEQTGQLTVAFWVQWNGPNDNWQGVVAKRDSYEPAPDGAMMWYFEISQGVNDIFFGRRGQTPASGGVLPIGEWKHIAVTCDGSAATMYIDSDEVSSGDFTFGPTLDATIMIGADEGGGSNGFNGAIDELRLYNTALTQQEIQVAMFEVGAAIEFAFAPEPFDGQVDVSRQAVLSWRPGAYADKHDVYFGTNFDDVNRAGRDNQLGVLLNQDQEETTYVLPDVLEYNTTYYWRIDEINDSNPESPWKGNIWSFTTVNFIVVDDFEDYNDYPPEEIFNTWIDGYDNPINGSTAGYPDPDFILGEHYMESDIVHSGEWSMPLFYDNMEGISEVVRTFDAPADWTKDEDDLKALVLWFEGDPANSAEPLYVAVEDSAGNIKVVTYPNPNAAQLDGWHDFNVLLTDLSDAGVNLTSVKKMYIGLGDKENPHEGGGSGNLFIDDIRVYRRRCVPSMAKPDYDLNDDCIVDDADLDLLMEEYGRSSLDPEESAVVYREAESAETISEPMLIYNDSEASAGQYIAVKPGNGSSSAPPITGVASYDITVGGGTYVIYCRTIAPTGNDDSFWLRIPGATTQTNNHSSGWIRWDVIDSTDWNWGRVQSMDDGNAMVQFTMSAGDYTLEIAYREDGALLDAIYITDNLNFDPELFEPLQYDLNGDGAVDDADVSLLQEHWLDEVLWP
jgi:hypothetical protein